MAVFDGTIDRDCDHFLGDSRTTVLDIIEDTGFSPISKIKSPCTLCVYMKVRLFHFSFCRFEICE